MRLRKGVAERDHVMGGVGYDHCLRGVVDRGDQPAGDLSMIKMNCLRFVSVIGADGLFELRAEQEHVGAVVGSDRVPDRCRVVRHWRIIDDRASVAVARELEIAEAVGTAEAQTHRVGSVGHRQYAAGVAVLDGVVVDALEIDLIRTGELPLPVKPKISPVNVDG